MAYGTVNAEQMTTQSGYTLGAGNSSTFKNRIINGSMVIDQRNAGASVTQTTNNLFVTDRWLITGDVSSKFTGQQSTTAPAGFVNSLLITSSSAYSVPSGETYQLRYAIEGFNVADLGWGTANAQSVTLSFWVRSSLTGTFGASFRNATPNRSYPFSYTINSANTWEQKSVTIVGDTSGTWVTNNGVGIYLTFSLGTGSTYSGSAGSWSGNNYISTTGATSVVGTNGATFYLTGVQLEVGSTATSFDYRPYGTELALCQRYYQKSYLQSVVPGTSLSTNNANLLQSSWATVNTASIAGMATALPVVMRTSPTATVYDIVGNSGKVSKLSVDGVETNNVSTNVVSAGEAKLIVRIYANSAAGLEFGYALTAEL